MFKKILVMVMALIVLTGMTSVMAADDLAKIKKAGKIVLGTAADYPPYEFHKEIDGEDNIVGFDIKIAEEVAKDLGVKLEIKDMKFNGLLAALKMGNIDFIIAGMVPTEERAKSVDFSIPYYQAEQSFLVKGEGSKYKTIDDLTGLEVGAQKSTVQAKIAKEDIEAGDLKLLSKITDLVLELKFDKIDGIVLVKPVASAYAQANDDLEVADVSLGKEDGVAIAMRKGSKNLLEEINKTLKRLMADDKISEFVAEATKMAESK